jgi:ferritin-like metal-binding protein YciE
MTTPEDHLLNWLRDAHAMEKQAETMLSAMAGRLEHYPELKARIEAHSPRRAPRPIHCRPASNAGAATHRP